MREKRPHPATPGEAKRGAHSALAAGPDRTISRGTCGNASVNSASQP